MEPKVAVAKHEREMGFEVLKNMLIAQNRQLLIDIARDSGRSEARLLKRYLKPEYYLPIVKND